MARSLRRRLGFIVKRWHSRLTTLISGRSAVAILTEGSNGRLLVAPDDSGVGYALRTKEEYGARELERICGLLSPDSHVLFIGAHVGALAIPVSRKCARVTAIEANPDTFALLEANARMNGCANVRLLNFAAGERRGKARFLKSRVNSGGSKREPLVFRKMYYYDDPKVVETPVRVLDEELEDAFSLVVMDIEGSEYFALSGMRRILERAEALITEFVPRHLRDVAGVGVEEFLEKVGPSFDRLTIPSLGISVGREGFAPTLGRMFEGGEEDEGVIFEKSRTAARGAARGGEAES